jgi:hypothetical protein
MVKNFHFCTSSRLTLGVHPVSYQMVPGAFTLGIKRPRREADNSNQCRGQINVDLYTHFSTRLHGVVLTELCIRTISPLALMSKSTAVSNKVLLSLLLFCCFSFHNTNNDIMPIHKSWFIKAILLFPIALL